MLHCPSHRVVLAQIVEVFSGVLFSSPKSLVSYAVPTVTAISGCLPVLGNDLLVCCVVLHHMIICVQTYNCSRFGGTSITINGTNFGAAGAQVFVGNLPCTSVVHVAGLLDIQLTCLLPKVFARACRGFDDGLVVTGQPNATAAVCATAEWWPQCQSCVRVVLSGLRWQRLLIQ